MKYIKTYENHSLDYSYEDAVSIFDSLRDFGYEVSVEKETTDDWKMEEDYTEDYVSLIISNENDFVINGVGDEVLELKDCVMRVIDFLKEWSYHLEIDNGDNGTNIVTPPRIGKDIKLHNDEFVFIRNLMNNLTTENQRIVKNTIEPNW